MTYQNMKKKTLKLEQYICRFMNCKVSVKICRVFPLLGKKESLS